MRLLALVAAALAAVLFPSACSGTASPQLAPADGDWSHWEARGDRADDEALREGLLRAPEVRARVATGRVHLLWLGDVPPDGGGRTELAVLAVERGGRGAGPRPDAPADVALTYRGASSGEAPSWGPLQDVAPLDPADPGLDVAALQDVDPAAADDAYLLRSDVTQVGVARPGGSRVAATVRPDGVVLVPGGGTGSCDPPVVTVPGHVLLPGVGAPLPVERAGDEAGLVSLVAGLICGPRIAGDPRIDLLTSSLQVTRRTGSLTGAVTGEVAYVRVVGTGPAQATLALIPPSGPATVGALRDPVEGGAGARNPLAVRIAVPSGSASVLAAGGSSAGPVTVPALPVVAGRGGTVLFGPAAGPVAVVWRDPQGAPSGVDLVR
jgi:hypothetical protein